MEETYGTCFSLDISVKLKVLIGYVSVRLSDILLPVQFDGHNVDSRRCHPCNFKVPNNAHRIWRGVVQDLTVLYRMGHEKVAGVRSIA
jgi:hypothetical protein